MEWTIALASTFQLIPIISRRMKNFFQARCRGGALFQLRLTPPTPSLALCTNKSRRLRDRPREDQTKNEPEPRELWALVDGVFAAYWTGYYFFTYTAFLC